MNNQEYLQAVRSRFIDGAEIKFESSDMIIAYEEVFKWKWFATKLKIMSFVKYSPSVQADEIEDYSRQCLKQAIKDKRGLPRGLQTGVVSNNVIFSHSVSPCAILFVSGLPDKHFAAFEIPAVFDLSSGKLYCNTKTPVWGSVYFSFIKEYLTGHFLIKDI